MGVFDTSVAVCPKCRAEAESRLNADELVKAVKLALRMEQIGGRYGNYKDTLEERRARLDVMMEGMKEDAKRD